MPTPTPTPTVPTTSTVRERTKTLASAGAAMVVGSRDLLAKENGAQGERETERQGFNDECQLMEKERRFRK